MIDVIRKLRDLLSRRDQRLAVVLLGMMLGGAILEMVGVAAIPAFIALLSDPSRLTKYRPIKRALDMWPAHSQRELVLAGAAVLLAIFVIKNVYATVLLLVQSRYATRRQVSIARRLFEAYLRAPYTFHLQRNSAELQRNANNEAMDVVGGVLLPGLTLTLETATSVAILGLLLLAEPFVSVIALVLLGGATALFIKTVRRRLNYYGKLAQDFRLRMIQSVNESLGSIKVTTVLGRADHFLRSYGGHVDGFADATRFKMVMAELPRLYLETVAMIGMLGIAALLLMQNRPIESVIPTLSLLAVAIVRMIPSFNRITAGLTSIRFGRFSLDAVHRDLCELDLGRDASCLTRQEASFEHELRLEGVSFRYEGAAADSLADVSLCIPRGSAVGIVGPTGSGKTTLVDVIIGLLRPTEGRLLIDGVELSGRESAWQRRLGYVPQDVYLVDDSIRRNIAFGISEAEIDEQSVLQAVVAAQLSEFISSLPDGLNTIVGDRGVRLSGGQRQRIGIARALYHRPDVLVMDEATSSLDSETEQYVMEAVEKMRGHTTMIIIAHRMSTVRACDRLFVLRGGALVESGSYEDLLAKSGEFRRLAAAR